MKLYPSCTQVDILMSRRKFWLLDYDPEGEIYDSVAWDLPGFRPVRIPRRTGFKPLPPRKRA